MANRGTGKSTSRLFVALDPPPRVCDEIAAWGREAAGGDRRMRPVPAANCHITLAFIGESGDADEAAIGDSLRFADEPVTGLSLGAPVWLPRRRPRALALDVHDGHGRLEACHARLASTLAEAVDWRPERRFRPHLTAARLGRGVDPASRTLPVSPQLDFSGESVTLYRSLLLPEGARYEAVSRVEL